MSASEAQFGSYRASQCLWDNKDDRDQEKDDDDDDEDENDEALGAVAAKCVCLSAVQSRI
jgi:hypothetical protein